jgi:citrate lyase beta subunit
VSAVDSSRTAQTPEAAQDRLAADLDERLARADADLLARYPGERGSRQPVHTVYVPADRYDETTVASWGRQARGVLAEHAGSPAVLAEATGVSADLVADLYDRVLAKLDREPIEDLRIDLEDGYGQRPDDDEDAAAVSAARALAAAVRDGTAPPYAGIRFKSFEAPTRRRGVRTLDLFVGELARAGGVGDGLVLTLPKVTSVDQVAAMVHACEVIEQAHDLPVGRLRFEIQVETPQSILGADGTVLVARMVHAAGGRCTGLHFGTYDYSASCGISAAYQSMEHPAADHAKAVMQVAAAGTGVFLSDGSTNVLPVGDRASVHAAWRLHARLVRRSLERGYYQGWDLHPAQLPSRFVATYAFYREGLPSAAARLKAYVGGGDSGYLDEPATAKALAGFVLRGLDCGAVDEQEVASLAGVDPTALAALALRPHPGTTGS